MLAYTLDHNLDGHKILSDIQKLVSKESPETIKQKVLVISLNPISNYTGDSLLPKITYDPDCLS